MFVVQLVKKLAFRNVGCGHLGFMKTRPFLNSMNIFPHLNHFYWSKVPSWHVGAFYSTLQRWLSYERHYRDVAHVACYKFTEYFIFRDESLYIFVGDPMFFSLFYIKQSMTLIFLCVIRQFDRQSFLQIRKHENILDFLIYFYYKICNFLCIPALKRYRVSPLFFIYFDLPCCW